MRVSGLIRLLSMAYLTPMAMPMTVMMMPILLDKFSPMNFSRSVRGFGSGSSSKVDLSSILISPKSIFFVTGWLSTFCVDWTMGSASITSTFTGSTGASSKVWVCSLSNFLMSWRTNSSSCCIAFCCLYSISNRRRRLSIFGFWFILRVLDFFIKVNKKQKEPNADPM